VAGWGNKTLTAKEILGMEPEELKGKLDSAASKDDVKAATDAVDGMKSTLAQLQLSIAALTSPPPPPPDPSIQADQNDPTTQILTDPGGFVSRATAPTQNLALETAAGLYEMRAHNANPAIFQKYGQQIMDSIKNFKLADRANPGFWDWHLRTYLGDKLMKGEIEASSYPSLMGGSSFAPNSGDPVDPNKGFDPEVAAYLTERKVPLEKAAAIQQIMVKNGDPIDIERYKKATHAA
jgi:hypothetical protein